MKNHTFDEIAEVILQAEHIGIACHARPDGDAIGSLVALGRSLQLLGKSVRLFCEDAVPNNLRFLPLIEQIERADGQVAQELDVVIALDNAVQNRLGANVLQVFAKAETWINIDHHITNPGYGDYNYVDAKAPATGEIIFDLLKSQDWPMDAAIRDLIYVAISTDTGSFQYQSTSAHTFRVIAQLLDAGSEFSNLCVQLYQTRSPRVVELQKAVLNEFRYAEQQRIAYWALSLELKQRLGVQPGDTEGLLDLLRSIDSVISPVFFEEMSATEIRVSARSKDARLDVSKVCGVFGGGGHKMASGARLEGPLAEAVSRFILVLEDEIKRIH